MRPWHAPPAPSGSAACARRRPRSQQSQRIMGRPSRLSHTGTVHVCASALQTPAPATLKSFEHMCACSCYRQPARDRAKSQAQEASVGLPNAPSAVAHIVEQSMCTQARSVQEVASWPMVAVEDTHARALGFLLLSVFTQGRQPSWHAGCPVARAASLSWPMGCCSTGGRGRVLGHKRSPRYQNTAPALDATSTGQMQRGCAICMEHGQS